MKRPDFVVFSGNKGQNYDLIIENIDKFNLKKPMHFYVSTVGAPQRWPVK
jgi:hypothetical protein